MNDNLIIAESYYQYMVQKNFEDMESYFHPDVQYVGPSAVMSGRSAVVTAAKNFANILMNINIRAKFASEDQIMMAYDVIFCDSIGTLRASVLMDFKDSLISKIELFYDTKLFEEKKGEFPSQ